MSGPENKSQEGALYLYGNKLDSGLPGTVEECRRLRRYIRALQAAHRKQIDALLAQLRQSGRQIAELRMEAGLAASAAKVKPSANSKPSKFARLGGAVRQRPSRLGPAIGPNVRGRKPLQRNNQGTRK